MMLDGLQSQNHQKAVMMREFRSTMLLLFLGLLLFQPPCLPGAEEKPLSRAQIEDLLKGGVSPVRITSLLEQRGINFEPSEEDMQVLKAASADDAVVNAVRSARQILPPEMILARHRTRAKEYAERGAGAEAEKEYRAAIALNPKDSTLHSGLARSLSQQQKWDGAATAYRQALKLRPKNFEDTYSLGLVLDQGGDQTEAINTWADAVKINGNDPRPFEQLARVFAQRRDWRRAAVAYGGLARIRPDSGPAHVGMGVALQNSGNVNGAIDAFRNALRINGNDPVAHNNLGFALEEKGDVPAALVEYRIAMTLSPQDEGIKANLDRATQKVRRPSLGKK